MCDGARARGADGLRTFCRESAVASIQTRRFVCGAVAVCWAAWAAGAAENPPATQPATTQPAATQPASAGEADGAYDVGRVTITGRKAQPVELGEGSNFTALPPRDLVARPLSESPGLATSTSVVGKEEIRWLDAVDLVDAMRYTPGAWTERRGQKVKEFFSTRGQRYPYPNYVIDGAWQREFHESGYFFPAAAVERIELVRSSAALLLGPGSMAGLVNVVPRTWDEPETRIDAEYGRFDTWLTQFTHGQPVGEEFSYGVSAGFRRREGPEDENAGEGLANVYTRMVWEPSKAFRLSVTGGMFTGTRHLEVADPPAHPRFLTRRDSYDPMSLYLATAKAEIHGCQWAWTEMVANFAYRHFEGHRVGSSDWVERDYEIGGRFIQGFRIGKDNVLRFGGMFHKWATPTGKRFYVGNPGDIDTYSGVIVDEHDFGRLTVNAGYRLTHERINDFGGFNVEGSPSGGLRSVKVEDEWQDPLHTISAGAAYELTDWLSLLGNAAWGQIASKPGMLNADLERPASETRTKVDVGVKGEWAQFGTAQLTAFYIYQQDAAVGLRGTKVDVNGEPMALFENRDRDSYGIEADIRTRRFDNGLQFFVNGVWMKTRIRRDGGWDRDREVPQCVLGGGASWLWKGLEISAFLKRVGQYENERFLPSGADPAPLGDFTDIGAKVSYTFGEDDKYTLFARFDNICDTRYSTVPGWPSEGWNYKTGFSVRF